MSNIGNVPGMHLNQYSPTSEQQAQMTLYQLKIINTSQKINPFSQPTKKLQNLDVREIGIEQDIEVLQQEIENLQLDGAENCHAMETMDQNLSLSVDFKIKNEFLNSVHKTNEYMNSVIDKISKFG